MIEVTRLNGKKYWVNPHQIESMEVNPDLTLALLSGKKVVIGVIWLIAPSPNPNRIYGYMSYLASVNEASYQYAQKVARNYFMLFGLIQTLLGLGIHFLHFINFFLVCFSFLFNYFFLFFT